MYKWTLCRSIAFLGLIVSAHGAFEECGSILMVEGNLQSHGYPNSYPPKFTCDWTIQAGPEDTVDMRFMDFDGEESPQCRYDYVQIFAMGYSPKYCGRGVEKVGRGGILSVTGEVKIVLKSDAADQFKGFSMQYKVTPEEPPTEPPEPTESPIPFDPDSVTCADEPCQNGADCIDVEIGEVVCFCADGFEGDFCEINIDECESTPCENGGTCIDGVNEVTCECSHGFIGQFCTVDLDECQAEPCKNGGTCIDGANSFECICVEGYTSLNCGELIEKTATLHSEVSPTKNFKSEDPQISTNKNYSSTITQSKETFEKQDDVANASEMSSSSPYVVVGVVVGILALLASAALISWSHLI